jgi:hypothetical protein
LRIKRAPITGVQVTASSRDASMAKTILSARARKKTPVTPLRNAKGIKTTTGVMVLPTSANPTSRSAAPTAVWGEEPARTLA